jgi:hypothetical protein
VQRQQHFLDNIINLIAPGEAAMPLHNLPDLWRYGAEKVAIGRRIPLLRSMHQETKYIGGGIGQ